jgi:hypothetical protein
MCNIINKYTYENTVNTPYLLLYELYGLMAHGLSQLGHHQMPSAMSMDVHLLSNTCYS